MLNGENKTNQNDLLNDFDEFYKNKLKKKLFEKFSNEPSCIEKVNKRFEYMIDYNVPHGKKLRGLCTFESLMNLIDLKQKHNYDLNCLREQAIAVGWCIEFLQASFLVADDIMDNSTYRRGQICWYLNKEVGNVAINDSFFLLTSVFTIITEFCREHPSYYRLFELFNQALTNTVIGQGLDLVTPPKRNENELFNFENYTEEQYYSIVKWKTAFYSFCLPVQAALYLAFIDDCEVHEKCKKILIDMGCFFQVQDDYLDCYGDPKVTGKVGTDIEESKCSWLVVQALKKCNSDQRQKLEKYYGNTDQQSVSLVKDIFNELKLSDEYRNFEQTKYESIMSEIDNLAFSSVKFDSNQIDRIKSILKMYAKKIFKRNK